MREDRATYEKRISTIKKDFSKRAAIYDEYIVNVVPHHEEMLEALINSMPSPTKKPYRILELGCGTGIVTYNIKKRYPNAHLKCIDMSSEMLDMARNKLEAFPSIEFELADFTKYQFNGEYDIVVSFLALMYLGSDRDRISIFEKAYNVLKPGGAFIVGEVNFSDNKDFQRAHIKKWMEHMQKYYADDYIKDEVLEKAQKHGTLSRLSDELQWLKNIGFSRMEVFWKYYNFTVYGAMK